MTTNESESTTESSDDTSREATLQSEVETLREELETTKEQLHTVQKNLKWMAQHQAVETGKSVCPTCNSNGALTVQRTATGKKKVKWYEFTPKSRQLAQREPVRSSHCC